MFRFVSLRSTLQNCGLRQGLNYSWRFSHSDRSHLSIICSSRISKTNIDLHPHYKRANKLTAEVEPMVRQQIAQEHETNNAYLSVRRRREERGTPEHQNSTQNFVPVLPHTNEAQPHVSHLAWDFLHLSKKMDSPRPSLTEGKSTPCLTLTSNNCAHQHVNGC